MFVINFSLPSINSIILNRAFVSAQFSSPPLAILQNILYRHCDEKQKRNGRIDDWKKRKKKKKSERKTKGVHWTLDTRRWQFSSAPAKPVQLKEIRDAHTRG